VGVAAVCGVLGRRTLGRGAISATSVYGLGRGKRGRSTREGGGGHAALARVCASEGVGRERLVPLVRMWIPLTLSVSLCGACVRVCIFVNIASKLVASFDLAARPDFPPREGRRGQKRQRRGMTMTVAKR